MFIVFNMLMEIKREIKFLDYWKANNSKLVRPDYQDKRECKYLISLKVPIKEKELSEMENKVYCSKNGEDGKLVMQK